MEAVIKKAEEARTRSLDRAKRIHEEYQPLKQDIDRMRREYLGLDRLPELHEEEADLITPEYKLDNSYILQQNISNSALINIFYFRLFARSYLEKQFKDNWRPEAAAMSSFAHAQQAAAASAFLAPVQAPIQLIPSSSKAERPMPPLPGPPPTFRYVSLFFNYNEKSNCILEELK
jgi:hypothetical protein